MTGSSWPALPEPADPWADHPLFPDFGVVVMVGAGSLPEPIMVPVVPGYYDRSACRHADTRAAR